MTAETDNNTTAGLKVARMVASGTDQSAAIDRGNGIFENKGIGSSYLITTSDGNVLVNTGTLRDARRGKALFDAVSDAPIRHIVLTQSHVNQFGGIEVYKTSETELIAQRLYPDDRAYSERLSAHYRRGSRRIFRQITGSSVDLMPTIEIAPDRLIDDYYAFDLGGRRLELYSTPGGETRCSLIVWLPAERIAIVGNLFGPLFGNQPNLNTLRGDKPRSALAFIDSVKRLRVLEPDQILTGHEHIVGGDHIAKTLNRIIDAVQWVHDQTVAGMNAGKTITELMRDIRPPPELALTEEYGKVSWNVRTIWHEYTGWYDPSLGIGELFAEPASSIAPLLSDLCGGATTLLAAARACCDDAKPLQALHLLDIADAVPPRSPGSRDVRRQALLLLQQQCGDNNLWERMSIAAELADLDEVSA